jgi:catechol 2,3-dioxygenase-like lactoylglutathione lyase family enzyme
MKSESAERAAARVTSSVLFVSRLDRSIEFYRDVFSCNETIREPGAALLLAPDGFQIYLIERGIRAEHPSGGLGHQYLIWAVDSAAELREVEQAAQGTARRTYVHASGGVSFLVIHDPDGTRVLVAHPGPDRLPRTVLGAHLYV